MARLSDLANRHSEWEVVALTGDCAGVLPDHWNDWPQSLRLSVPGNHDSPETFLNLTSWIHNAPWFSRHNDLAFLGIDTSDLSSPFGRLEEQLENAFDCEAVRGKYEKPKRVVIPASTIRFSVQPRPAKERQWNTGDTTSRDVWIKCKCGLSQKRSRSTCSFCGKPLRGQ